MRPHVQPEVTEFKDTDGKTKIKVKRRSTFSGESHEVVFSISKKDFDIAMAQWDSGILIQDAFSMLTRGERKFLITGSTEEEWVKAFGGPE